MTTRLGGLRAAAALGTVLLACAQAGAIRPITPLAPEFPPSSAWMNSKPFTMKRFKGRRAVVVAFINTANLNSLRTLPALSAWFDRYALEGLMVIAVHSPAYGFQKDPVAVKATLERLGLEFPVVIDNDMKIWRSYANEGWPALYLVDHNGRIVYDRLGEDGYEEFEAEIRAALAEVPGYEAPAGPLAAKNPSTDECGDASPETGLGSGRAIINMDKEEAKETLLLLAAREGEFSTRGDWSAEADLLQLSQRNADQSAFLRLIYRGAQAFALLGAPGEGVRYYLRQDDLWLHAGNAGKDVEFDADGRSYVTVSRPKLYDLAQNPSDAMHILAVIPVKIRSAIYGFSFSDQCHRVRLP